VSSKFDKLEATLPRDDYVAADRFAAERDFIFHKEWFCAGRCEGVANKGEYRLVNKQDWAICENVQRGMNSRIFESGYYAPMEDWSLDIRNYVRDRLPKQK